MPQGTVLGPLLYSYAIFNNLPSLVISKIRMYADDTLTYNTIFNINDRLQLQNDICEFEMWTKTWQINSIPLNVSSLN